MKIRSGFVSNSSSSSFVIVASKEAYDRVYASVDSECKALMDVVWGNPPPTFVIGGNMLYNLSYVDHDGGYWYYASDGADHGDEENWKEREKRYHLGKCVVNALKKDPDVFMSETGC